MDIEPPKELIGRSTVAAIQSGIVYGFAGQVDGIVGRLREEMGDEITAIATGGLACRDRPLLRPDRRGRRPAHPDRPAADLGAQPGLTLSRAMRSLNDPWTLGGLRLPNRLVLAPLAGIGNWFVRLQAKRHGAGLVVSEMVSSFGLKYGDARTHREFLRLHPDEHPVSIQLFGHDPDVMREAAEIVAAAGADLIDINMGCPVRKVCKTGAGASLLEDQDKAVALARAAGEGSGLPVTVKLRSGHRPGERTGVELARRLVAEAGVAGIGFHPRHASQQHRGRPTTRWPPSSCTRSTCR